MGAEHVIDWPPYGSSDRVRRRGVLAAARLMMNAAITAPCPGGTPQIEGHIVYGQEEQERIARKMEELAQANPKNRLWKNIFKYEAVMARESDVILFLGNYRAAETPMESLCGYCGGAPDCTFLFSRKSTRYGLVDLTEPTESQKGLVAGPLCVSAIINGLAFSVGSALWMANRLLVDARPMMSMGVAGQKLGYCPRSPLVVGIPVAALPKNPYVDIPMDYHLVSFEKMVDSLRKRYYAVKAVRWPDYRFSYPRKAKDSDRHKGEGEDGDL